MGGNAKSIMEVSQDLQSLYMGGGTGMSAM